jgi:hypothetical protein
MASAQLSLRTTGNPGWTLLLDGSADGDSFTAQAVILTAATPGMAPPRQVAIAYFPTAVAIPKSLLTPPTATAPWRFKTFPQIGADAQQAWYDTWHRLQNLELDWAKGFNASTGPVQASFLGITLDANLAATFSGSASFKLEGGGDPAVNLIAEISFHSTVTEGTLTQGWSLRLRIGDRIDLLALLDDLHIAFPTFDLSLNDLVSLDWTTNIRTFQFPASPIDVKLAFSGLLQQVGPFVSDLLSHPVDFAWTDANGMALGQPPKIALYWDKQPTALTLCFAVVAQNTVLPADFFTNPTAVADFGKTFARAKITVPVSVGNLTVSDCYFARTRSKTYSGAAVTFGANDFDIPTKSFLLGPFRVAWSGAKVRLEPYNLTSQAAVGPSNGLRAKLTFDRLSLSLIDDPSTVLSFKGTVNLTPSSMKVESLDIIQPTNLPIVPSTQNFLTQGFDGLQRLLIRFDATMGDAMSRLLEVLSKFAGALSKISQSFPQWESGGSTGWGFPGGFPRVSNVLDPIGTLAAALFHKLAEVPQLLTAAGSALKEVHVELRISSNPLQLRQILIRPFHDQAAAKPYSLNALGFNLHIKNDWTPAVLIDVASDPGVYLLVLNNANAGTDLAGLSTDLWLKDSATAPLAPVQDATGAGTRPTPNADPVLNKDQKPLLEIDITAKGNGYAFLMAGLQRGKGVFFQRAVYSSKTAPSLDLKNVSVIDGPLAFVDASTNDFGFNVQFQKDRLLSLFGSSEPQGNSDGTSSGDSFLDKLKNGLGQVVTVKDSGQPTISLPKITIPITLEVQAAGLSTDVILSLNIDLKTLSASLDSNNKFTIQSQPIRQSALGLYWVVTPKTGPVDDSKKYPLFDLTLANGESQFALNDQAQMEVHFKGLSPDGDGIVFTVSHFAIGRGGLDLEAVVTDHAVTLNGLDVPFQFTDGRISIKGGRLVSATVEGSGKLPPALLGDASCSLSLTFGDSGSGIVLQSGKVKLDKMGEPIVCHSTRFTLTITNIELGLVVDGGYHFYFLIDGSLRFTPNAGEFGDGFLKFLKDAEIKLTKCPLTGDASVVTKHIEFQVSLSPKVNITLFDVFKMELRGIGYHASCSSFDGSPALSISGQLSLGFGDVMHPKIDFHKILIAPPKAGESLPRILCEGLDIELQMAGGVRVKGAVLAVDKNNSPTLEGIGPAGYEAQGFLGSGALDIPGWGSMEATLGFLEVNKPGEDKKVAFFLYLQKDRLAVEIPTPFWVFYLREAGFGFGYRYTLAGIKEADSATSSAQLIQILDKVSSTQGDLSDYTAWAPDPEGDKFTLALKGAIQTAPAQDPWDDKTEDRAQNPFLLDLVVALRSDFTFLMSARVHFGVNYAHYQKNDGHFRENPLLRGFMYISVPRSEVLLRAVSDPNGYIGTDAAIFMVPPLPLMLKSVTFSSTLYIRPGLFQFEMGWPNQLSAKLIDDSALKASVCGGMIFRVADDGLLYGLNAEAQASFHFDAGMSLGFVGASVSASMEAKLVVRFIAYLAWHFSDSFVYGLVSLDARLDFSVRAWLHIDLWLCSIDIHISFTITLQFTASVELVLGPKLSGAHVQAMVAIQVFGCSLGVNISFSIADDNLNEARARVARFMTLSLTADQPAPAPVLASAQGDSQLQDHAAVHDTAAITDAGLTPPTVLPPQTPPPPPPPSLKQGDIAATNFYLVLYKGSVAPTGYPPKDPTKEYAYGLLVPKEAAKADSRAAFYCSPMFFPHKPPTNTAPTGSRTKPDHIIAIPTGTTNVPPIAYYDWSASGFTLLPTAPTYGAMTRWTAPLPADKDSGTVFGLCHVFDTCFIDQNPQYVDQARKPVAQPNVPVVYAEPSSRVHGDPTAPDFSKSDRDRDAERLQMQKMRATASNTPDEKAWNARSMILQMFLDQFVSFAQNGARKDTTRAWNDAACPAHVGDLGLLFYGSVEDLVKFDNCAIFKADEDASQGDPTKKTAGKITLLNARNTWFDLSDPIFANTNQAVDSEGIKLDWQLQPPDQQQLPLNIEHFLHHYEVIRTCVDYPGIAPVTTLAKAASTLDKADGNGNVALQAPEWQYTDALSGDTALPSGFREALLPTTAVADAAAAEKAWLKAFDVRASITLAYTVTPVDIAGMRGLPKSFVVKIDRPESVVRPALAQLYLRQDWPYLDDGSLAPEKVAHIYLALRDDAWDSDAYPPGQNDSTRTEKIDGVDYVFTRSYKLHVHMEDLEPSGHYGTNAATARQVSPISTTSVDVPDKQTFPFGRNQLIAVDADPNITSNFESDAETLKKYPRWVKLDSTNPDLVKLLAQAGTDTWRGFRFFLETVITVTLGSKTLYSRSSDRVVVPAEHLIKCPDLSPSVPVVTLRPDVVEWAKPLNLAPLQDGQVRTKSGFARYSAPGTLSTLKSLLNTSSVKEEKTVYLRDPDRQILTTISFDVVSAALYNKATKSLSPDRNLVSEYEVYELDLDSYATPILARATNPPNSTLAGNADAWRQATLIGRVELLTEDMAHLMPASNNDFNGWHAHYPSETWKLANAPRPLFGDAPKRADWFSAAESTVQFPVRIPRLRFFPQAPDSILGELFQNGSPQCLQFKLQAEDGSKAASFSWGTVKLGLWDCPIIGPVSGTNPFKGLGTAKDWFVAPTPAATTLPLLSPDAVRRILLAVGANLTADLPADTIDKWRKDPTCLRGLQLVIRSATMSGPANALTYPKLAEVTLPIDLNSAQHPLLEELLGELSYAVESVSGNLCRRYAVNVQPPPPLSDKTALAFISRTQPGTDPYGWGVLQTLGLAAALRLFDTDSNDFVTPSSMLKLVSPCFNGVLSRWVFALKQVPGIKDIAKSLGEPFAEVHLKPGADRSAAPFDSMTQNSIEYEDASVKLEEDGLSLVQLSLRPAVMRVWSYATLKLRWNHRFWTKEQRTDPVTNKKWDWDGWTTRGIQLKVNLPASVPSPIQDGAGISVARLAGGVPVTFSADTSSAILDIPLPTCRPLLAPVGDDSVPELTLVLRLPAGISPDDFTRSIQVLVDSGTSASADQPSTIDTYQLWGDSPIILLDDRYPDCKWHSWYYPGDFTPDPFNRFDDLVSEEWAGAFSPPSTNVSGTARSTFQSLQDNLFAARQPQDDQTRADWTLPTIPVATQDPDGTKKKAAISFANSCVPWLQRFLDYTSVFPDKDQNGKRLELQTDKPWLALAAPLKAQPWRLAPNSEAQITLNFTYADRWAHARAYAVKPVSRYQHVLDSSGMKVQEDATQLVPDTPDTDWEIGFGVAVTQRTEKVERPVIQAIPTHLNTSGDGHLHLIVARHPEEIRANSNRSLLANLQKPGSVWTHSRSYLYQDWLDLLNQNISAPPKWEVLPPVPPNSPRDLDHPAPAPTPRDWRLDSASLKSFAQINKTLFEGASLLSIDSLPPHYDLSVLWYERSGLVISEPAAARFTDLPRVDIASPPEDDDPKIPGYNLPYKLSPPALEVSPSGELTVRFPLISHAQLTPSATRSWIDLTKSNDVAWAPDPGMAYIIQRTSNTHREVDAEILLGYFDESQSHVAVQYECVATRARGSRYQAQVKGSTTISNYTLPVAAPVPKPLFAATTVLQLADTVLSPRFPEQVRIQSGDYNNKTCIAAFNAIALPTSVTPTNKSFGVILYDADLTFDCIPGGSVAQYTTDVLALLDKISRAVAVDQATVTSPYLILAPFKCATSPQVIQAFKTKVASAATPADVQTAFQNLIKLTVQIEVGATSADLQAFLGLDGVKETVNVPAFSDGSAAYLRLWDLASEDAMKALRGDANCPPLAKAAPPIVDPTKPPPPNLLARLYREKLLGSMTGFELKIADTRVQTVKNVGTDLAPTYSNPGTRVISITSYPLCAT